MKIDVRTLARTVYIGEAPTDMDWLEDYTTKVLQAVCDAIPYVVDCYDESAAQCVSIVEEMMP